MLKDTKANTNVIGTIISLAIMLMVGVLLLGQFQQQADSQMDEIGDPATNLITATSVVKDTWISLSFSPLVENSESVTNGTTTYTKSTDYAMGYGNGTILIYATGSIANDTMLSVEYDHMSGTTHDAYDNVKNSSWGAMNLMGMYPWILGAVALLSVVVLIGRRN
ncbi:MAG: hypothetical protein KAW93_06390 [Methanogenium sp.]|nr:hypothetical protein [Methanogenium sp.]